jgi:hypothetical protein
MLPLSLCIFAPTDHVEDGGIQCLMRRVPDFAAITLQTEQFPKSDFLGSSQYPGCAMAHVRTAMRTRSLMLESS